MSRSNQFSDEDFFRAAPILTILYKIAPPVMLAQLIQALYNIVDSFFVGKYSVNALTALSVIYPLQLIIIALAVGTGVGVNTFMARKYAHGQSSEADLTAGTGMVLSVLSWLIFALISTVIMRPYVMTSATDPEAIRDAVIYGRIVCLGSIGVFLEGNWTKVHQAQGNMRLPMFAQIAGALTNIILDPLLIFGIGPFPELGVAGAAYATVCGQIAAAVITGIRGFRLPPAIHSMPHYIKRIYYYGYPSIIMQALFTVYIVALNIILAGFSDSAVTVLGLYYKVQTFFFIPLMGLQTCIVPVLSFNYACQNFARCRSTMKAVFWISGLFMALGSILFFFVPRQIIGIFSDSEAVLSIGASAFPIIGSSFIPAVFSLTTPVFFQAIGNGKASLFLSLMRQIFCLIPSFWLLSLIGLDLTWFAFPISEVLTGTAGLALYIKKFIRPCFPVTQTENEK
ncbi:MAG: MATE family efflux transporter [Eubacteriales bacterium]|nr:MATE family efflux transporter [Eubacteriales bacterium]